MNHSGALRRNLGVTVRDFLSSGKRKPAREEEGEIEDGAAPASARDGALAAARAAREALMQRIADFLIGYDLDITPANLTRAHALFSGEQPEFAALVEEMEARGEPITQHWLDAVASECENGGDERAEVDALAANLQTSIETFTQTARAARSAAADYRTAITEQAEEAERVEPGETAEHLLARVGELTRAMRERTQQAEEKMQRSEREANSLRRDLEKAQRAANIDHLTGLPNRRALDTMLEGFWQDAKGPAKSAAKTKAKKSKTAPVVLAFCDIDHFKPVNDIHGHDTGDRVLQMVARTLAEGAGELCQVVRYGGEEFVVVYRGQTVEEARDNLDAIRATLARRPFVNRNTQESLGTITFSGGIADLFAYPDHRAALRAADEALYRAKREGRNRVELAATA